MTISGRKSVKKGQKMIKKVVSLKTLSILALFLGLRGGDFVGLYYTVVALLSKARGVLVYFLLPSLAFCFRCANKQNERPFHRPCCIIAAATS